jgi:hypothetical protein
LVGEAKHKPFKAFIVRTNNRAVDLQLIRIEMERTAIRFTLDGAFRDTHPTVTAMLGRINEVCPQLFIRVSPVSRWIHRMGIEDDEFIGPLGNASAIRVLNKIKEHQLPEHMPPRASLGSWIRAAVLDHYSKTPATALPASLPAFRVRYFSKVTFLSPATQYLAERVMSFEAGQMFYSTSPVATWCLEAVVVPTIQETRDVLFLAHQVVPVDEEDPILHQRIYTLSNNRQLVPVCDLRHEYAPYMIYSPASPPSWMEQQGGRTLLWQHEWFTGHY